MEITLDFNKFTLGELEILEEELGTSFDAVFANRPSAKAVTVLVWLMKRREDPDFTMEQARSISIAEIDFAKEEDETDPT